MPVSIIKTTSWRNYFTAVFSERENYKFTDCIDLRQNGTSVPFWNFFFLSGDAVREGVVQVSPKTLIAGKKFVYC